MGTRGLYGFRKNGVDKLTYNHFDSYPSGLGRSVIEFIQDYCMDLNDIYKNIILVDEDSEPTESQIKECEILADLSVSKQSLTDWYCLLRNAQGNPKMYGEGLRYMIDNKDFILDSLFCEYAYIINLDTKKLEIYSGFQKVPDESNIYGCKPNSEGYYPCKLAYVIDLLDIIRCQDNDVLIKQIQKALE
jgi:hypothetical protein